ANLNPLPPVERGRKYVEYMGGAEAAIRRAREDFARGEYRFVAEAMSHVVFADPDNVDARHLGADALEQLGYAAESATWRNAYLLGALELRQERPASGGRAPVSPDVVRAMSLDLFFDYLAVRLDGQRAEGRRLVIDWVFADLGQRYALNLENCALTYLADRRAAWRVMPGVRSLRGEAADDDAAAGDQLRALGLVAPRLELRLDVLEVRLAVGPCVDPDDRHVRLLALQCRAVKPKLRVWVVFGPRLKLGDGRARLLDAIHAKGSLRQAAADFGMSYRNAWGYLQELERAAGFKFFERTAGGGPASGMRLTAAGREFL